MRRIGYFLLACLASATIFAAELPTPLGSWQTIDDKTGQPRAVVQIYTMGDALYGRIDKSFTPGAESRTCAKCGDERKDKPIIGLIIIRNLHRSGATWQGGDILDPESGSVYRCRLEVSADNQTLNVRGYIGFALIGRTQVWKRLPAN